jgi:hypothetical protein
MYAYVLITKLDCALARGISAIEVAIEAVKSDIAKIVKILFVYIRIFSFLLKFLGV